MLSLTQPVQQGVESFVVLSIEDSELGYVISVIPKYYLSPVQIIAKIKDLQFKYYIRSGSSFSPANHDLLSGLYNRQRSSELVYLWQGTEHNSVEENEKILSYQFNFVLQNKGLAILRDIWANFSSSGFTVDLLQTNDSQSFDIWNAFGKAANFISKDGFKRGPQGFISPFGLQIKLTKNDLPENPWIYISYGSDQVAPTELKSTPLTRKDLENIDNTSINPNWSGDWVNTVLNYYKVDFDKDVIYTVTGKVNWVDCGVDDKCRPDIEIISITK